MSTEFLDFERPVAELEAKIDALRNVQMDDNVNITEEIARLTAKSRQRTTTLFSALTAHQIVQLARHTDRPHTSDYIQHLCTDYDALHGDRCCAEGTALMGGLARFHGQPVVVIGHEKGRRVKDKVRCNFGMPLPEEYRKAQRLMRLAERFGLPILTFIDTPGAYPGVGAEERNQSGAIAQSLFEMSQLTVPIIVTVIGEGGSGGALAIGVGDRLCMLQYSIYSVISPEGCAAILWKSAEKAQEAADAMKITSDVLFDLGLVDEVLPEPLGGAHRDPAAMYAALSACLLAHLTELKKIPPQHLVEQRYQRYRALGAPA